MKAIINGKRYDTDKASLIGEACASCPRNDFRYWDAGLYKTAAGNFFLAGEGGPMTRWAVPAGNTATAGSSGIFALDSEEALRWAEEHLDPDKVESAFGDMIEDA